MGGGPGKEAAQCECNAVCSHCPHIKAPLHSNASTTSYAPKHLPKHLHYAQKSLLQTHGGDARERPGLRHGAEDRLQTVLETGWWMAALDANYDSQLDKMIVATSNKFTVLKKFTDDIAVLL